MLYPMFFVFLITLVIGCLAVKTRLTSVKLKHVKPEYFKLMQGENIPENVLKTTRCFNNMFEVPILFYIICSLHLILEVENNFSLGVAWLYVFFRLAHTYIHLGNNHVRHRMYVFLLSVICIFLLWINLLVVTR